MGALRGDAGNHKLIIGYHLQKAKTITGKGRKEKAIQVEEDKIITL